MKKDPFMYAHEREEEVIWLSQNTNQLETTPKIKEAIIEAVNQGKYNLYPHKDGILGLKELILKDLNLTGGFKSIVTNGGMEATYTLTRAMLEKGDNVIASDPSFMPIHHQIELCDAQVKELNVYKDNYRMSVDEINESVDEDTKMILLIDPLNPLGSSYTKNEIKGICDIAEDNDLFVIDDVTYRDFAYEHTLTTEFIPEKTFLVYTFSKSCGFAGMRLGALIMPDEYHDHLYKYRTNVLSANVLAQVGAKTALKTKLEWIDKMIEQARKNQAIIKNTVDKIDGLSLPVYPSNTNMFAIDIQQTGINPEELQEELLYNHDIFIRSGTYVSKNSGNSFIRVSFTVPEDEIILFTKILPKVIDKLKSK